MVLCLRIIVHVRRYITTPGVYIQHNEYKYDSEPTGIGEVNLGYFHFERFIRFEFWENVAEQKVEATETHQTTEFGARGRCGSAGGGTRS